MLIRVGAIAYNTYREAVRARILHGLFAAALGATGYSLIVGAYALKAQLRVVSDLGAAATSIFAIVVAIVIGATSLYRELELKTIFPILARPIRRGEYLVGKLLGTVLTLAVFVAANSGVLLLAMAALAGRPLLFVLGVVATAGVLLGLGLWRLPKARTWLPIPWAIAIFLLGFVLAADAPDERRVIGASALLVVCEVSIVVAIATLFSSFSSPFLTAVFTLGSFVVGRSADTLAAMPERLFGAGIQRLSAMLSKVVPNLMIYQPERPLLTGEAADAALGPYLAMAALHAVAWTVVLLALSALIFRRRDFL
jgi:Cu-processing system permease protein